MSMEIPMLIIIFKKVEKKNVNHIFLYSTGSLEQEKTWFTRIYMKYSNNLFMLHNYTHYEVECAYHTHVRNVSIALLHLQTDSGCLVPGPSLHCQRIARAKWEFLFGTPAEEAACRVEKSESLK